MRRPATKKLLNIALIVSFLLTIIIGMMGVGGGGVLNDSYDALAEIKILESKNLLNNLPKDVSSNTRMQLKYFKNSQGVQEYINSTEKLLIQVERIIFLCLILFVVILITRIFYRKKKDAFDD